MDKSQQQLASRKLYKFILLTFNITYLSLKILI